MKLNGLILPEEPPEYVLLGDFAGSQICGMPIIEAFNALTAKNGYPDWIGQGIRYLGANHKDCAVYVKDIKLFIQRIRSYYATNVYPWEYLVPQSPPHQ